MDLQKLNATIEYDPVYGNMLVLDSYDWEKTYEQYSNRNEKWWFCAKTNS